MNDLLSLLNEKLGGRRYAGYLAVKCPFPEHQDSKPSMMIYPDRYHCLGCGRSGTTESLARKYSTLPTKLSVETTPISTNPFTRWLRQHKSIRRIVQIAQRNLQSHPSHYLRERGIEAQVQQDLGLGILDGWVVFPVTNFYNEIVGGVARVGENNTATSKYYIPNGQSPELLYVPSWERIRQSKEVFVTFGIVDAVTLYILGKASASTLTGQSVSKNTFKHIHKRIIFVPDKWEEISARRIASRLDWRGSVLRLPYPPKIKDTNEWFVSDKNTLMEVINA